MRPLRKLAFCPSAAHTFLLSGRLPMRRCAQRKSGNCARPAIRGATAWRTCGCAACLNAGKNRGFPAGSLPLTVLGANVHGPRDSDSRMCAQH